jgi:glycine hydroxymethyltransferase
MFDFSDHLQETGIIDYDKLAELAPMYRPKLLVTGASAYPRLFEFDRLRKV